MIGDLPDLLSSRASLSPETIALEEVASGRTLTYAALNARAARAAAMLAARGIAAGDRVALICRNRLEFWELLFGCARLGAILVPLNGRAPAPELDRLLADADPALLCCESGHAPIVAALAAPPPTLDLDADYEAAIAAAPEGVQRPRWPSETIWYLIYTSGTTGRPKGVINTFRMALANHINIGLAIGLRPGDTALSFLPNFHTAGINLHALPVLLSGGRVLILDGFDAGAVVRLLEARRLDFFFAVPTVYQDLLDHPGFGQAPLDHVRHWGCGGAPFPDRLAERCRAIGLRVCQGMGMTETGPTALLNDPASAWDRMGSVGKPQLLCAARIVDPTGSDAPPGAVGELFFAGPGVTPGYWRNAAATEAALTADGWLRSGDLARRDADGFYYVVGRRKEMYISGGENVYPAEVENVLSCHPDVVDAAVLPVPDQRWGEVGRAFVQLAPGADPLRDEDLDAYCRARLAAYKVPRSFRFVDAFPRTSAGKIQKHLLA